MRPLISVGDSLATALLADTMTGRQDGRLLPTTLGALVERGRTNAFLVLAHDTVLVERYFRGFHPESLHTAFSMAKSVLSLAAGFAVAAGKLADTDSVARFLPELAAKDPRLAPIQLRHLLTMSAGLAYRNAKTPWGDPAKVYYGTDLREVALTARFETPAGQRFQYNNYNPLIVGLMVERATGQSVSQLIEDRLWTRLGAERPASWSLDSKRSGFEKMESGFNAIPRDFARLGLLMLERGVWGEREIIAPDWIDRSTARDSLSDPSPDYQYFWWIGPPRRGRPTFWAEGRFGQFVWVSPGDGLVIVRVGDDDGDLRWPSLFVRIADRLRPP